MRLIHMRKGVKKGICAWGKLRRNVAGDEFSVRSVLISVLGNLYADYKKLDYYTKSLLEFSDAEFTAKAMLALVDENSALAEYKDAIEEDIAEADDAEDVARARRNIKNRNLQLNFSRKLIEQILNHELPENHFFCNKVTEITPINAVARFFSLSECEARLVAFFACWYKTSYFDHLADAVVKNQANSELLSFVATAVGMTPSEVSEGIRILKKHEILHAGRRTLPELSDELEEFIFGYDGSDIAQKFSAILEVKNTFPPESFGVPSQDISILKRLLVEKSGTHILFYGKPGVGKTEFAKSLSVALGKKIFVPERGKDKKSGLSSVNLQATLFAARNAGGIALIDEADDFLETSGYGFFGGSVNNTEKGSVNTLMDESNVSVIWITNSVHGIDTSTRRRFAFTLEFSEISDKQRRVILDSTLKEHRIPQSLGDELFRVARHYKLSPAGISLAVKNAKIVSTKKSEIVGNMTRIAQSHYTFLTGCSAAPMVLNPDFRFDKDLLNTTPAANDVLGNIERYRQACERAGKTLPLAMLFTGLPGTGKTQLGRYIAQQLGKEILLKRMSDIKDPYVGMTERHIAEAFAEARMTDKVLMIDEADTLFIDRQTATRSWEASGTNELLAQMEAFEGVFICTTNLVENFDAAAMRRFQWKVQFKGLEGDAIVRCFLAYFPRTEVLRGDVERELKCLVGLCPGDFKAAHERLQYELDLSDEKILEALRTELDYKQIQLSAPKPIGFC